MTKSFESNSNSNESITDNSLVSSFSTSLSISVSVSASASNSISASNNASSDSTSIYNDADISSKAASWRSSVAKEAKSEFAKSSNSSSSSSSSSDDNYLGGLGNADFLDGLGDLSRDMPSNSSESSSEASAVKSYDASVKASKASLSAHIKAVDNSDFYSDNRYYDVHDNKWGTATVFFNDDGSMTVSCGKISNRPLYNALPKGQADKVKSINFFDVIAPMDCNGLLSNLPSVTKIDLSDLNMNNAANIHGLFAEDLSLHEVNLTSLNTNRINDMHGMFFGDDQVKLLKLGEDTILDDTIAGHINDDYWYETSTGYEDFLHSFNIKGNQIFINDGAPEKINLKNLTSSLIGSYLLKHNKSLANFAQRFKSPVINGNIINPVLGTKLLDIKDKLKVYDTCLSDFYITYKLSKCFENWCLSNYSKPLNAQSYSQWRATNDYNKCFDSALNKSFFINKVKAAMAPKEILKMLHEYDCMVSPRYNHTTHNQNKLLGYLIKHNIDAEDALVDVKDEPKFKYITTHDDDKASLLKIKLKNKISQRNKLQFLHEYFDSNIRVYQLLANVNIPDDLSDRQFLRKIRYNHDLIKKYNTFYNKHRFVGESRTSKYSYYYYEEMAKALKQGVLPKSMLTKNYINNLAYHIRGLIKSTDFMFCRKDSLFKKLDKGLESGDPVKALLNNCAVLKDIHEDN